jgi:galactokinase
MATDLDATFATLFGGSGPLHRYQAPGRVNLIGEHLDYNGGAVLPAAIALGITALVRPRSGRVVRLASTAEEGMVTVDLDGGIERDPGWGRYPQGVLAEIGARGVDLRGCDVLFQSTLPSGAGLSSSAALEVLTGFLLLSEAEAPEIDLVDLALLCQRAENHFVGVNCGIMDQFAVALSREGHALFIDCSTLGYRHVPIGLDTHSLVVMHTGTHRALASSKYNERRAECDRALAMLGHGTPPPDLAHAALEEVERTLASEPVLCRRARHVVTEQARVLEACRLLEEGEAAAFGRLLVASHESLRRDYEVTGRELDAVVESALAAPGCLGARMTGAGFGGCAVALVENQALGAFSEEVAWRYRAETGLEATLMPTTAQGGVGRVA